MKKTETAVARGAARRDHISQFNEKLEAFDKTIEEAREFVRSAKLRELKPSEVETMLKRANVRVETFRHLITKPLEGDLKRREQERRKANV